MKVFRIAIRVFIFLLLFVFSFAAVYPLIFLLGGSLKSTAELGNSLAALWSADGTIQWTWLPFEPTLRHYVELLLDEPGYYVMFWNSVKIGRRGNRRTTSAQPSGSLGICTLAFSGEKGAAFALHRVDAFPVSDSDAVRISGLKQDGDDRYHVALILPGVCSTFPVFIMYRFFSKLSKDVIEAAKLDGANEWQIFRRIGIPLGMPGIMSVIVLDFLEYWNLIEQPDGISQNGTVKTVVIIYLDDHEGECRCCVCGSTGCAVATVACVPVWAQISGTGNCGNGWW